MKEHHFIPDMRQQMADAPRSKRGRRISMVRMAMKDWETIGEPLSIRLHDGRWVPVEPTGRKPGRFSWFYEKKKQHAFSSPSPPPPF